MVDLCKFFKNVSLDPYTEGQFRCINIVKFSAADKSILFIKSIIKIGYKHSGKIDEKFYKINKNKK